MKRTITSYRIVDHGIEHEQYFQGHGTAFTDYTHTALGCGDNFAEAIDDALEVMAQGEETSGVDFEAFERTMKADHGEYIQSDSYDRTDDKHPVTSAVPGTGDWLTSPSVSERTPTGTCPQCGKEYFADETTCDDCECDTEECESSELQYYVSIDYTVGEES